MLWYSIVQNKSHIKSNYLKEDVLNLLDKTFVIPDSYTYNIFEVSNEYIARPDLIALDAYGDTMYTDVMCKLNGISNPFELNENDYLFIPSLDYIRDCCIPKNKSNTDFIETSDDEILAKTSNYQKRLDQKRTPNEQIYGEQNFVIDKSLGVIFY